MDDSGRSIPVMWQGMSARAFVPGDFPTATAIPHDIIIVASNTGLGARKNLIVTNQEEDAMMPG